MNDVRKLGRWSDFSLKDKIILIAALVFILFPVVYAFIPVPLSADPYGRVNLLAICFVIASFAIGLCDGVSSRLWGSIFGVAGLLLWLIGMYFDKSGIGKAFLDMVAV